MKLLLSFTSVFILSFHASAMSFAVGTYTCKFSTYYAPKSITVVSSEDGSVSLQYKGIYWIDGQKKTWSSSSKLSYYDEVGTNGEIWFTGYDELFKQNITLITKRNSNKFSLKLGTIDYERVVSEDCE